jgi:hypothetical protein
MRYSPEMSIIICIGSLHTARFLCNSISADHNGSVSLFEYIVEHAVVQNSKIKIGVFNVVVKKSPHPLDNN